MTHAVRAAEITALLDHLPEATTVLSLDCFDTLIWRNVNQPVDVFHDLDLPGCGGKELRICAEQRARKALALETRRNEVTIDDIYAHMFDDSGAIDTTPLIRGELDAEAHHCFAFRPVRDLILEAKRRGLKVIIVSDTYLHEPQLRALIASAAGQDVLDCIDHVFCSCEYGESKSGGLFRDVLAQLGISPGKIAHLGDNPVADVEAPRKLGIHGVHFEQFDAEANDRLRLEAVAATLIERDTRRTAPALQPHRPQLSLRPGNDPLFTFGHDVLGPIFQGFTRWIAEEADTLEAATGKKPKLLFLLRDGYLPAKAFEAAFPDRAGEVAMVEISRFTAYAASFTDRKAIESYLVSEASSRKRDAYSSQRQNAYCQQLLFSRNEASKLARIGSTRAFIREVLKPENVAKITSRSKKFAQGLFAHLRSHGVEDGDAVMLIDLGYNGSAQNAIDPVLRAGMNLDVAGRYLLLREQMVTGLDKKGMIDARHYDQTALYALCESIAVMEQLCTRSQGSVMGYDDKRTPLRDASDIKGMQSAARDAAQAACLTFIAQAGSGWAPTPASWDGESARRMAAAALARLLFLPTGNEVAIFRSFIHDVNMGTRDQLRLVDPEAAAEGLRRRGLFYTRTARRMYLPGELQPHGMPALLSLFAGRRFDLDLRQTDFQGSEIRLPVILADEAQHTQLDIRAYPTSDGYYQALIPVGTGRFTVAVMIGQLCDWLQIDELAFHAVDDFMKKKIDDDSIPAQPVHDGMSESAPGLYHCSAESAFILVPPPDVPLGRAHMLSCVFRPVVLRGAPAAEARKVA